MDRATHPSWGPADAVMSFQVLINVAFFCFGGTQMGERMDEGGWPIRRCDLIPARLDMWPIGLHVFALSLSFSPSLSSPAAHLLTRTHTVGR